MGGIFAHQHGCDRCTQTEARIIFAHQHDYGRCTQTEARIADSLLQDEYFSIPPVVHSSFESNK